MIPLICGLFYFHFSLGQAQPRDNCPFQFTFCISVLTICKMILCYPMQTQFWEFAIKNKNEYIYNN